MAFIICCEGRTKIGTETLMIREEPLTAKRRLHGPAILRQPHRTKYERPSDFLRAEVSRPRAPAFNNHVLRTTHHLLQEHSTCCTQLPYSSAHDPPGVWTQGKARIVLRLPAFLILPKQASRLLTSILRIDSSA